LIKSTCDQAMISPAGGTLKGRSQKDVSRK